MAKRAGCIRLGVRALGNLRTCPTCAACCEGVARRLQKRGRIGCTNPDNVSRIATSTTEVAEPSVGVGPRTIFHRFASDRALQTPSSDAHFCRWRWLLWYWANRGSQGVRIGFAPTCETNSSGRRTRAEPHALQITCGPMVVKKGSNAAKQKTTEIISRCRGGRWMVNELRKSHPLL